MEENKETIKKSNTVLIVLLILIILGLAGYIVYDKVLSEKEQNNGEAVIDNNGEAVNQDENEEYINYNEEYFNELLSTFLAHSNNYMKNISTFNSEEIATYLFFYYSDYANKNNLATTDNNGNITYNISKAEIDGTINKIFGKTNIEMPTQVGRTGIKKLDDNTYQAYWFATGWNTPDNKIDNINKNDTSATIEYKLIGNEVFGNNGKTLGTLKFNLTKNGDNWNVTSIEYIENK